MSGPFQSQNSLLLPYGDSNTWLAPYHYLLRFRLYCRGCTEIPSLQNHRILRHAREMIGTMRSAHVLPMVKTPQTWQKNSAFPENAFIISFTASGNREQRTLSGFRTEGRVSDDAIALIFWRMPGGYIRYRAKPILGWRKPPQARILFSASTGIFSSITYNVSHHPTFLKSYQDSNSARDEFGLVSD